jgi:hypothetical protein
MILASKRCQLYKHEEQGRKGGQACSMFAQYAISKSAAKSTSRVKLN